jgi:hypothetical protein
MFLLTDLAVGLLQVLDLLEVTDLVKHNSRGLQRQG